ncbi:FecR family protein [Sulfurimonas sp. HSL-1716]|uniref:FecR family protein n=1 Tax=Hydrocurvibacter sulfurireducens TaxID=3131937 RepID=UPI0031F7B9AA
MGDDDMRLIMFLLFSSMLSFAMSADKIASGSIEGIGIIENVKGSVKIIKEDSIKKENAKKGMNISKGDLISTSSTATALLKLIDGSSVILDNSSSIHFTDTKNVEQKEGSIFYKITSRSAKNSLSVKTPFAIIGIKGTTFIVNSKDEDRSVALKEGKIGIASIKEEFELYRKRVQEEFTNYKNQQQAAYEQYLKELAGQKAEMVKEFELDSGNRVVFDDKKVVESEFNDDTNASFKRFEDIANSMR